MTTSPAPFVYEIRQSPLQLIFAIIFVEILIAAVHFAIRFVLHELGLLDTALFSVITYGWVEIAALQLFNVIVLISLVMRWLSLVYVIKSDEIRVVSGLLNRQTTTYDINSLQSVTVEQSLLGRIFNYGNIRLYNPAWNSEVRLNMVPSPNRYRSALNTSLGAENTTFMRR